MAEAAWHRVLRDGCPLACRDFGGAGPPVLLLHGLAGHAEEWAPTARWLASRAHVLASDARGHGRSARTPADVSPEAHVADAAFVLERCAGGPAVLVGQSLGGLTAISLAARRPDLVRALVVVEASPAGDGAAADGAAAAIGEALRSWPVPFASREAAFAFFLDRFGSRSAAEAWTSGLQPQADGWRPRFEIEVMVRTLGAARARARWDDWERIVCPTLVLRADRGFVDAADAEAMARRQTRAHVVEVPDAAHDLHLDRPAEWRRVLTGFLDSVAVG